jgi:hypothetical protein
MTERFGHKYVIRECANVQRRIAKGMNDGPKYVFSRTLGRRLAEVPEELQDWSAKSEGRESQS